MTNASKIYEYKTLRNVSTRIRDDLNDHDFVLIFAYNGTGKTRLSMDFKDVAKKKSQKDTLYFNAFTEDLFNWHNDLDGDSDRFLLINSESAFFKYPDFKGLSLEEKIFSYLQRYADFDFRIDYDDWKISFSRDNQRNIKVSRGEENIFIWCVFLAICELTIDGHQDYAWVKYLYIDDPISSLDDNNAIAVASDLAKLLHSGKGKIKAVISSHHGLFFNVMCNEFKRSRTKTHFYHRAKNTGIYTLRHTDDTPFFHHVAVLSELKNAVDSDEIYTYHFNMLRSILEKTATFFGFKDFSACIHGMDDEILYARALNLLSHGQYSIYEPNRMVDDNKELFKSIFTEFINRYKFDLPNIAKPQKETQ